MEEIMKKLIELNFNISSTGFEYWIDAIKYAEETKNFNMEDIFRYLAKKNDSTRSRVERNMRFCLSTAKNSIAERIENKYPVTTKAVLRMISLKII